MRGLGKGLDALISGSTMQQKASETTVSVYLIDNNTDQPRKYFNEEKLKELATSIEQHGVIQPIIVKKEGERYKIIAGERRYRAARLAGLNEVPVIVRDMDEQETLEVSLIENLHREDLNPMEEAEAIEKLIEEHDLTQEQAAQKLGRSRSAVTNTLRLLQLPKPIQQLLRTGKLTEGHARVLSAIDDEKMMLIIADKAAQGGWSVRETENRVYELVSGKKNKKTKPKKDRISVYMRNAQDKLTEHLGSKVKMSGNDNKGKIVIEYSSKKELSGLFDMIIGKKDE